MTFKLIVGAITLAIACTPTWLFLIAKHYLSPEGFWQKAFVYGAGVYFLGGVQIVCLLAWLAFMLQWIYEDA